MEGNASDTKEATPGVLGHSREHPGIPKDRGTRIILTLTFSFSWFSGIIRFGRLARGGPATAAVLGRADHQLIQSIAVHIAHGCERAAGRVPAALRNAMGPRVISVPPEMETISAVGGYYSSCGSLLGKFGRSHRTPSAIPSPWWRLLAADTKPYLGV